MCRWISSAGAGLDPVPPEAPLRISVRRSTGGGSRVALLPHGLFGATGRAKEIEAPLPRPPLSPAAAPPGGACAAPPRAPAARPGRARWEEAAAAALVLDRAAPRAPAGAEVRPGGGAREPPGRARTRRCRGARPGGFFAAFLRRRRRERSRGDGLPFPRDPGPGRPLPQPESCCCRRSSRTAGRARSRAPWLSPAGRAVAPPRPVGYSGVVPLPPGLSASRCAGVRRESEGRVLPRV